MEEDSNKNNGNSRTFWYMSLVLFVIPFIMLLSASDSESILALPVLGTITAWVGIAMGGDSKTSKGIKMVGMLFVLGVIEIWLFLYHLYLYYTFGIE